MNLSLMHDFNEAELGMMNDVTKRLRKSQRDIIEVLTYSMILTEHEKSILLPTYLIIQLLCTCSLTYSLTHQINQTLTYYSLIH